MSLRIKRVSVPTARESKRGGRALLAAGIGLLSVFAYAAGCSLPERTFVNDVGNAGGSAGMGGASAGGKSDMSTGGQAGSKAIGGSAASDAGSGGNGEGGEAGAPTINQGTDRPVPKKGLIVIGGTAIDQTKGEISVIEPVTGKELNKEMLPANTQVAAIAYDGAAKKDVWFVFVSSVFPAAQDKVVELQVRYFDDVANAWLTLSKLTTLPPPVAGTLAVLNDRLAYLSHTVVGGKVTPSLTLLDTSNVLAVKTIGYTLDTSMAAAVSLIGSRGTSADANGLGGTLDLGLSEICVGRACRLNVLPIAVGDSVVPGQAASLGMYQGAPLSAASQTKQEDYFLLENISTMLTLYPVAPNSPEQAMGLSAPQTVTDIASLAIADCQNLGIFSATTEHSLSGLTLGFGAGKTFDLGHDGQLVAYEPFSGDIIAPYNPTSDAFVTVPADSGVPGPEITAVTVASTGDTNLSLTARTKNWDPPTNVRTNVLATRFPVPFACK
jgi:hypothetical protein